MKTSFYTEILLSPFNGYVFFVDFDEGIEVVRKDEQTVCNQVSSSDIVHNFGVDSDKPASQVTIKELLLTYFDKGLKFNATEKGRETFQNFRCFTGIPAVRSRGDEARVRNALYI